MFESKSMLPGPYEHASIGRSFLFRKFLRTHAEMILNTLLCFLLAISYIPKIYNLICGGSTPGVSLASVVCTYLFATGQLTNTLYHYDYFFRVFSQIAEGRLRGLAAYTALLGLIQVTIIWIASAVLLVLVFIFSPETHWWPMTGCIAWTIVFLLPSVQIVFSPAPDDGFDQLGISIIAGIHGLVSQQASPFALLGVVFSQLRMSLSTEGREEWSCLSMATIGGQALVFVLSGLSWLHRLDRPLMKLSWKVLLFNFCRRSSWPWLYLIVYGLGLGVLFCTAVVRGSGEHS